MFIGHYGVALAAKKVAPKTSLGALFLATSFIDLLWPLFLLAGLEQVRIAPGDTKFTPLEFVSYPYSHSLLMVALWGIALAVPYKFITRYSRGAFMLWALTASHWFLDLLAHRPDMPLMPFGATKVGFGLWNSVPATLIVETAIFAGGVWVYLSVTRAQNKIGSIGFWALLAFFMVSYISAAFGPPPPNVEMIGYFAPFAWIFVLWGHWVDRNRSLSSPSPLAGEETP
jgi:hypothetical protein